MSFASRKYSRRCLILALSCIASACSNNSSKVDAASDSVQNVVIAALHSASDPSVHLGTITFVEATTGGVEAQFNVEPNEVISGGLHAIHLHQTASCDGADTNNDGKPEPAGAAGGHFNPTGVGHGDDNGPHIGDSEKYNYRFGTDGSFKMAVRFPKASLSGSQALTAAGGSALIIHQGIDDGSSDPAGNAGPRIACAVITK